MSERMDLTGQRFGQLVVIDYDHTGDRYKTYWRCLCDCGNEAVVEGYSLRSGRTSSCGCKPHGPKRKDLTGMRFGRLVVLSYDHSDRYSNRYWRCICDCGNETISVGNGLLAGTTASCGCRNREIVKEVNTTHGMWGTRLYKLWSGMIQRCTNPNGDHYDNYGGRGIFVCNEWNDFENFKNWALDNGYKEGLTIDRINNDDGYYPENCRWVDQITQQNNRRNNRYITWNAKTHTIAEWARLFGLSYNALWYRVRNNDMRDFEDYFKED